MFAPTSTQVLSKLTLPEPINLPETKLPAVTVQTPVTPIPVIASETETPVTVPNIHPATNKKPKSKRSRKANVIISRSPRLLKSNHQTAVPIQCPEHITGDIIISPSAEVQDLYKILIGNCIAKVSNGHGHIYIFNMGDRDIRLPARVTLGKYDSYSNDQEIANMYQLELNHLQKVLAATAESVPSESPELSSLEIPARSPEITKKLNNFHIGENVDPDQKQKLHDLLERYLPLFSYNPEELGRTNVCQHEIETGNSRPIQQRAYRVAPKERELISKRVEEMLQQ